MTAPASTGHRCQQLPPLEARVRRFLPALWENATTSDRIAELSGLSISAVKAMLRRLERRGLAARYRRRWTRGSVPPPPTLTPGGPIE